MTGPDVSVVVIVYNDAARLPAAVNSILDQTLRNLEVLIVNDCSTDNTRAVADGFARADARVRAIHLEVNSGGCSRPRNVGLEHARAPYVLFVDSDDTYERHSCKNLLLAAERHDADIVIGKSRRCYVRDGEVVRTGDWYHRLHRGHQVYDDISENPELLFHTLATDKLYRVELLNRENIRFPEGWLYEDLLFNVEVFGSGARIAVIPNLVHNWMVDAEAENPSITNQRGDFRNFEHRVGILRKIDDFLHARGRHDLKLTKDIKFVRHDLRIYLNDLPARDAEYQQRFMALAGEYLRTVDGRAMAESGVVLRVACFFILRGDLDQVLRAVAYFRHDQKLAADLVTQDGRVYWCEIDPEDAEARAALDVTEMHWHSATLPALNLYHEVRELGICGSVLTMRVALNNLLGRFGEGDTRIELVFRGERASGRPKVPVHIESVDFRQVHYTVSVDVDKLLPIRGPRQRRWSINARVTHHGVTNVSPLTVLHPKAPAVEGRELHVRPPAATFVGDRLRCSVTPSGNLDFQLTTSHPLAHKALPRVQGAWRSPPVRGLRRLRRRALRKLQSQRLKTLAYRQFQRLPVKAGSVIFEANMGRQFGDSPKYVYEALRRSGRPFRPVWSYRDGSTSFPQDVALVKRESWRYYYELARAEYWVDNQGFPRQFTKRAETTYLQTWHGTPLKHMGWDEPQLVALDEDGRREHQAMIDRWDHLVVPNEYFVDSFVRSYDYRGNLLRVGYPRNDLLARYRDENFVRGLRTRLGLPLDRKIVLYAPTFRPRQSRREPMALELELSALDDSLSSDYFFMVRTHYFDKVSIPQRFHHFVRSVNDHDDVTELLLVADVLITDYSSVMFDYASVERPIIIFAYDYDDYLWHRGTYFDLRAEAPGPVVTTTGEIVQCLRDLDALTDQHGHKIKEFHRRFAQYETGHAAETVAEHVFGTGSG